MDRRKKMLRKRRKKQKQLEEESPGHILVFGDGTAAVKGIWNPKSKEPKPLPCEKQP